MPGKRKNFQFSEGFTLIEFLVVVGILAFAVSTTLLFLNSVLKSANQSHVVSEVKQNGQSLLDILDKEIRNSVNVEGVAGTAPDYTHIRVIREKADPLYIKCFTDGAGGVRNNRIGNAVSASGTPADSQFSSMTNENTVSGVDITNCSFGVFPATVTASGVSVPTSITINFTVSQGLDAPSRVEFKSTQTFRTSISLRRY